MSAAMNNSRQYLEIQRYDVSSHWPELEARDERMLIRKGSLIIDDSLTNLLCLFS